MGWRINTRAEAGDSRHFDSGWIDQDSYKPSDGYIPRKRDGWTLAQLFCAVVSLGAAAVVIALEVAQWIK